MQKQFKYIFNDIEVSKEDFQKLTTKNFKWFENNSINSSSNDVKSILNKCFNYDMEYLDEILDKLDKKIGVKHNQLKPRLDTVINVQFPKAIQLIALASEYGNHKYYDSDKDMLNFKRVSGGSQTYFNSAARHNTDRQGLDESGLPHVVHVLWNYLAGLELWVEENKIDIKEFTENFMKKLAELK